MNFSDFNIQVKRSTGKEKTYCPMCRDKRTNKNDKSLSVNHDEGLWKCHYCNWSGNLNQKHDPEAKKYKKPEFINNTELSDKLVQWFKSRGIAQFTLREMKISESVEYFPQTQKKSNCINFNYFRDEVLINIKYRDAAKNFKMFTDAELIPYNLDGIKNEKTCYIVEGEMDALTLHEIGIRNFISVPNGANKGQNNLTWLDNSISYFDDKDRIIIATDNDSNGISLRNELIRRLGAYRCEILTFGECKDANEFLMKNGREKLLEAIKKSKPVKMDGIFNADDLYHEMLFTFRNGKNRGTSTFIKALDNHWTWRTKEINIWTGYNNEGKTTFLFQLMVLKAVFDDWKFGLFSPENYPIEEIFDELINIYIGKPTDNYFYDCMSEDEYLKGHEFISDHFFIVYPENDFKLETLFDGFKYLVSRNGIKAIVCDPYNQIEHLYRPGEREDLYISRFMTLLKKFSVDFDLSVNLVAHQKTPILEKNKDYPRPDIYSIKGGGTFADKADNVVSVWRPYRRTDRLNTTVKIIIDKIKKQKLVGIPGEIELYFERKSSRYFEDSQEVNNVQLVYRNNQVEGTTTPHQDDFWGSQVHESEIDDLPF